MVYLIHFDEPLKHARHYVGFVDGDENLQKRMDAHKANQGAKLIRAVNLAGIKWVIARVFSGKCRNFERSLKNTNDIPRYCPICAGKINEYKPRNPQL